MDYKPSVRTQLSALVGFLVVAISLMLILVLAQFSSLDAHIKSIAHKDIPVTSLVTKITEHQLEQEIKFEMAFRYALAMDTEVTAGPKFQESMDEYQALNVKIEKEIQDAETMLEEAVHTAHEPEDVEAFNQALQALLTIDKHHKVWHKHVEEVFSALVSNDFHQAEVLAEPVEEEAMQLTHEVEALLDQINEFTYTAVLSVEKEVTDTRTLLISIALLCLFVGAGLGIWIVKNINTGLNYVSYVIQRLAQGNFKQSHTGKAAREIDVVLQNTEAMRQQVHSLLSSIIESTKKLLEAVEAVTEVSSGVQTSVRVQAEQMEQVNAAVCEMTQTAREVAESASSSHESTEEASTRTDDCQRTNNQASDRIKELVQSVSSSAESITELDKNSENIGAVLDVIKSIAEQTNLLALNAAIEAARAGEQGRGFAVVADEVRTLAQRTQESTTEIENMIEQFRSGTKSAVGSIKLSIDKGDETVELADRSRELLNQVMKAIANVTGMSMQIASAAEEQSSALDEINRNLSNINEASKENSTRVEIAGKASGQLKSTVDVLNLAVKKFEL